MIERHLRRANPTLEGLALRRAVQEAFDSYARYWIESFRLPSLHKRVVDAGLKVSGLRARRPTASTQGNGVILALPHLGGWEWAGRWLDAPRRQDHRRRRAARSARAVRLVRRAAQRARHDGGRARARRRQGGARRAQAQRGRVPAVRPRPRRRRRRGRVLRRAHDAAGRPRHARHPHRRADPADRASTSRRGTTATSVSSGRRSTRHGRGSLRDDVARVTQQLARELELPDPPGPPAVAPVPAQLAIDPGYGENRS